MERGFFITGVAGQMAQNRLDSISHNLANVNTAGYRADRTAFSTMFTRKLATGSAVLPAAYPTLNRQYIDTSSGEIRHTGRALDVAINGDAYFKVQMSDGRIALTRAGNFRLDGDGRLTTWKGLPVLDAANAPIELPRGEVGITASGAIYVDNQPVADLGIVQVVDARQLSKAAGSLLLTPETNLQPADASITVEQGALEQSNVNAILAMAELVDTMRSYQSMMKMIEQYNHIASQLNDRVAVVQG